jgi:filamentous hemagglutinin
MAKWAAATVVLGAAVKFAPALAARGGATAITRGEQVTESVIRNAMKDARLSSQQAGGVSLPRVQQYVDKLLAGEAAPGIKVDGSMSVDGNRRYVAGRILGQEPAVIQWLGGRPASAVPWADMPISPEAW